MSYIELINRFWAIDLEATFSHTEVHLYFKLLEINNRLGWKNEFKYPNTRLEVEAGMRSKSLINARQRLVDFGLIKYKKGTTRNAGMYSFVDLLYNNPTKESNQGSNQRSNQGSNQKVIRGTLNRQDIDKEYNSSVEGENQFSPQTQKNGNSELLSNPNSQNHSKSGTHVGETGGGAPEKSPPGERKSKKPIKERAKDFKNEIWQHAKGTEYETEIDELRKFWEYWSEHGSRDRLMRYEKEKSFSITRRLRTWFDNREKFRNNGTINSTNIEEDRTQAAIKETYARLAAKSKSYY